jgi:putative effector of murein hydrolase LrgA (UPF0299 family)
MGWKASLLTWVFIGAAIALIPAAMAIRHTAPLWVLAVLAINLIVPYLVIGWLVDLVRQFTRAGHQPLRDEIAEKPGLRARRP